MLIWLGASASVLMTVSFLHMAAFHCDLLNHPHEKLTISPEHSESLTRVIIHMATDYDSYLSIYIHEP